MGKCGRPVWWGGFKSRPIVPGGFSRRPTVDSKSEEEVSADEGQVEEFCARNVRGDDKAETRMVMDSFFQIRNLRLLLLFSHQVVSGSLWPRELQYAWLPCQSKPEGMYHLFLFGRALDKMTYRGKRRWVNTKARRGINLPFLFCSHLTVFPLCFSHSISVSGSQFPLSSWGGSFRTALAVSTLCQERAALGSHEQKRPHCTDPSTTWQRQGLVFCLF